jgi:excisionase family DNA binding protein
VSIDEACQTLGGISTSTLRRLIAQGDLKSVKLRRRRLVLTSSIERLLEERSA